MGNKSSRVAASQGQKIVSQHSQQLREQIEKQVIEEIKAEHVTKEVGARMSQFVIKSRSGIKEQVRLDSFVLFWFIQRHFVFLRVGIRPRSSSSTLNHHDAPIPPFKILSTRFQEAPDTLKNRDKLQADSSMRLSAQDIAHILSTKDPHQIDYLRSHINYPLINDNVATYRE